MAAFARAVELGYRYLETDVQVTADEVLVAFHDDRLDRVTDRSGEIGSLTWPEVRAARIGGGPVRAAALRCAPPPRCRWGSRARRPPP